MVRLAGGVAFVVAVTVFSLVLAFLVASILVVALLLRLTMDLLAD